MNSKDKGNAEERKQAKQLSIWMFKDPDVLKRHPTSGTDKSVYSGDIIPLKQLEPYGWKEFKIFIEVKTGYDDAVPTPYKYTTVEKWFRKAILQAKPTNQHIIFLICQFKNKSALLITNQDFSSKIMWRMVLPIENGDHYEIVFVYLMKDILSIDFYQLFENIDYGGL